MSRVFNGFAENDDEQKEKASNAFGQLDLDTEEGNGYAAKCFAKFDTNGDHALQIKELYNALNAAGETPSYGQIYRLVREYDTDGDGEINFVEFKEMLKHIQKGEFDDYNSDDEAEWYKKTHGVVKKDYYTPRKPKVEADVEIAPHTTRAELNNYLGANLDATTRANAEEFVAAKYGEIIRRNNELEYQIQN